VSSMAIANQTRGGVLARRAEVAATFWSRGVGLLGRKDWSRADGLIITPCNSIHCLFMSLTIDVLYVGADGKVLRAIRSLRPWRVGPIVRGARSVVELPAGTISDTNCQPGDQLVFDSAAG
jgi:uncharacterized protein